MNNSTADGRLPLGLVPGQPTPCEANSRSYSAQRLLWFSAGFALATVLSIGVYPMRFIPVSVAFGLLCLGTGVVFTELPGLRRQENRGWELIDQWTKKIEEVDEMKAKLQEEKESVEEQGKVLDHKIKEVKEAEEVWLQGLQELQANREIRSDEKCE